MFQSSSRINIDDTGIKFYEQDVLYDNYIYKGDFDITLDLEYITPGFGIGLTNSEGVSLSDKDRVLLFKMGYKNLDIITVNNGAKKAIAAYSSAFAITGNENLMITLSKRGNQFSVKIGDQTVCTIDAPIEFQTYNVIYYSSKDNVIKTINIASDIPYGWVTNMQNANGGYIVFYKDAFEFKHCSGNAEIEQSDITLSPGKYYLKYDASDDCDITPYVFPSDSLLISDDEKNILSYDNSFEIDYNQDICLRFVGSNGKIKNIAITTEKDNQYIRTSPEEGSIIDIAGSEIAIDMLAIKSFGLDFTVNNVPGSEHITPSEYFIFELDSALGIIPLNIAIGVSYKLEFDKNSRYIQIKNNDNIIYSTTVDIASIKYFKMFKNVNAIVSNFTIVDNKGDSTNVVIENTVKRYVPGTIFSPIVVTSNTNEPLDISSSYRIVEKDGYSYYYFTNTEREYFEPDTLITLTNTPSLKDGTIIVYGIKKGAIYNMNNLLKIKEESRDTIELFSSYYDILFEKDLRSINKDTKEIRLESVEDYELVVVDYLKDNSYSINYRHDLNSYEVDISINDENPTNILYNNAFESEDSITYINEFRYVNTGTLPTENCYIAIGGD